MDKFTESLTEGIRRFALAGVGAVSITIDKSREIIDQLVARGEVTAAEGQAACDDLQKKMSAQFDAFSKKLRADYENSSFESLLKKCDLLTPEQKEALIARLTAEPEPVEEELSESSENETDNSVSDEGFLPINESENSESAEPAEPESFIDSNEEICPESAETDDFPQNDE